MCIVLLYYFFIPWRSLESRRLRPDLGVQESVWDYPRPPRFEKIVSHVQVYLHGKVLAETRKAIRVLETSHPPTFYIPPEDVQMNLLTPSTRSTFCEWKGGSATLCPAPILSCNDSFVDLGWQARVWSLPV